MFLFVSSDFNTELVELHCQQNKRGQNEIAVVSKCFLFIKLRVLNNFHIPLFIKDSTALKLSTVR